MSDAGDKTAKAKDGPATVPRVENDTLPLAQEPGPGIPPDRNPG
jgi:hypothetical protein